MANPYLQARAPGFQGGPQGAPRRKRPNQPQGVARGQQPGFQGGPVRQPPGGAPGPIVGPGGRPNPMPPVQGGPTGGQPGPVVQGGRPGTNPNSLMGVDGHDPLGHQRYWANQGYLVGGNDRFGFQGDGALRQYLQGIQGPGGRPNPTPQPQPQPGPTGGNPGPVVGPGGAQPNPTTPGGMPGGTPGPQTGPGGQGQAGLPLDPIFEMQRRGFEDQLAQRLGMLNPLREQIGAQQQLQSARFDTNEGVDRNRLLESLNARGAYGGGIQSRDMGMLGTDYLRQRQDLANDTASQYGGIAGQEGDARLQYMQQLQEALLAAAGRASNDPYAAVDRKRQGEPDRNRRRKRRAGGGR